MEHGASASRGSQTARETAPQPPRPMDRVGEAASRIDSLIGDVSTILARFQDRPPVGGGECAAISVSYLDQVSRLHGNIDLLGKLIVELDGLA